MTGSCPEQDDHGHVANRLRKAIGRRGSGHASRSNLLYLRGARPPEGVARQDLSGALYTLGGVVLGLVAGAVGYHYRLLDALVSPRDPALLLFGAPRDLPGKLRDLGHDAPHPDIDALELLQHLPTHPVGVGPGGLQRLYEQMDVMEGITYIVKDGRQTDPQGLIALDTHEPLPESL